MGCGASKAAQVADTEITTERRPSVGEDHQLPHGEVTTADTVSEERTPSQSAPEPTGQDGDTQTVAVVEETRPKFEAFEVRTNEDERIVQRGPLPRRLTKLESVPKFTPEMLVEKQRQVEERKKLELEKRATMKLSKKERLRRQVAEARDMTTTVNNTPQMDGTDNGNKAGERALNVSVVGGLDAESGTTTYDPSIEIDTDLTYNTDQQQADFWEGSETNSVSNDKPLTDKNDDEGLFGAEKLEHYL